MFSCNYKILWCISIRAECLLQHYSLQWEILCLRQNIMMMRIMGTYPCSSLRLFRKLDMTVLFNGPWQASGPLPSRCLALLMAQRFVNGKFTPWDEQLLITSIKAILLHKSLRNSLSGRVSAGRWEIRQMNRVIILKILKPTEKETDQPKNYHDSSLWD